MNEKKPWEHDTPKAFVLVDKKIVVINKVKMV
jgi:hypothetical protein